MKNPEKSSLRQTAIACGLSFILATVLVHWLPLLYPFKVNNLALYNTLPRLLQIPTIYYFARAVIKDNFNYAPATRIITIVVASAYSLYSASRECLSYGHTRDLYIIYALLIGMAITLLIELACPKHRKLMGYYAILITGITCGATVGSIINSLP